VPPPSPHLGIDTGGPHSSFNDSLEGTFTGTGKWRGNKEAMEKQRKTPMKCRMDLLSGDVGEPVMVGIGEGKGPFPFHVYKLLICIAILREKIISAKTPEEETSLTYVQNSLVSNNPSPL
jgi:hypothetical protein